MPKDESEGLFSKVVKFVRSPATNWADLDQKEADKESTYTKQALKEMIERKRRNDFVRKREFDMLRKMRRREAMAGADAAQRPSFFASSLPSKPDDRANTLKKIDEIEAQMSMQWWKTKHADSITQSTYGGTGAVITGGSGQSTQPIAPHSIPPNADDRTTAPLPHVAFTRTQPPAAAPAVKRQTVKPTPQQMGGLAAGFEGASTGFTASKLFAVEVGEVSHDAELEEASIRFANSDDAAAEAGLREAIKPGAPRGKHEETWYTLFDLFRATGQQNAFESLGIDFTDRFDKPAPVWFSIPELIERMSSAARAATSGPPCTWICPPLLDVKSAVNLNAILAKAEPPWLLDWTGLTAIESTALGPLRHLFGSWAAQDVQLAFIGGEEFDALLKSATPNGVKTVNAEWWKLRLEWLRVVNRPDEFEVVALDYCVTYEVSPPSWEVARCSCRLVDGLSEADPTLVAPSQEHSTQPGNGCLDTQGPDAHPVSRQMTKLVTAELSGEICGDASAVVESLQGKLDQADILVVSCSKLIRVDFSAAGTLLNWVTTLQGEGRIVQFNDMHRLVAAFFSVIGISEHAKVTPRKD